MRDKAAASRKAGKDDNRKNSVAPRRARDDRRFDMDDPDLPAWIDEAALTSGGYPYDEKIDDGAYKRELKRLQIELVKLQHWTIAQGERLVIVFEGRDAAGKGGAIGAFREYMSPRATRVVALPKPTEVERGQWYFQRYLVHLPTRGEILLFDRSWYNRAGVEPVMGFCTPEQTEMFLHEVPRVEDVLVDDGIRLVKFYIEIGREMQLKQLHQRRHDPLKTWKISPIDHVAVERYDDYSAARDRMLAASDSESGPWMVVLGNDKKRARLEMIRHVLRLCDYPGRDAQAVGEADGAIIGGPEILAEPTGDGSGR